MQFANAVCILSNFFRLCLQMYNLKHCLGYTIMSVCTRDSIKPKQPIRILDEKKRGEIIMVSFSRGATPGER